MLPARKYTITNLNILVKHFYKNFSNNRNISHLLQSPKQHFYQIRKFCSAAPNSLTSSKNVEEKQESNQESFNYDVITNGDKDVEHKLKVIMLEVEILRQEAYLVPEFNSIKPDMWQHMLELPSRSARRKYLEYLFKISKMKEKRSVKQTERRIKFEEFKAENETRNSSKLSIEEHAQTYGLNGNALFLRIYDSTINNLLNYKLIQSIMFGQKIVIDCGYDVNMTIRENKNCAKQIMLLFADNRNHKNPFDIYHTSLAQDTELEKALHKYIPTMYEPGFPFNVHKESYLDLFPKEKLVYLTPHCNEEMTKYDHDAIYIVGGLVDKTNSEPLSLAKAKRENLKMQKLPLDKYLSWNSGSGKSLTLNQCILILLDLKETGNWEYALRHVPRRKIFNEETFSKIPRNNTKLLLKHRQSTTTWRPSKRGT